MTEKIIVKKVIVGTPVRKVTAGSFAITNLGGVDVSSNESDGSIIAYKSSTGNYEVTKLTGDSASIHVAYDSANSEYVFSLVGNRINQSLIPDTDSAYDLGASDKKWKDLHLSGGTINLGGLRIKDQNGTFVVEDSGGNTLMQNTKFISINADSDMLKYDSATSTLTWNDSDVARTDRIETFHKAIKVTDSAEITSNLTVGGNLNVTGDLVYDDMTADSATFSGSVAIGTNLSVGGNLNVAGDLVYDDMTADSATFAGTVSVGTNITSPLGRIVNLTGDSATVTNIANTQFTGSQATIDSADITVLKTTNATIDSATVTNLANTQFTGSQATIDSADITTIKNTNFTGSQATFDSANIGGVSIEGNNITTGGKIYYANVFSQLSDLPDASAYHGMFAHVHATGKGYFAHGGSWHQLLDKSSANDSATITNLANTQFTGSQATIDSADIVTLNVTGNATVLGSLNVTGDLVYDDVTADSATYTGTISVGTNITSPLGRIVNLTGDSATITNIANTVLTGNQATLDSATITNLANTQLTGSQATFDSATITSIRFDNVDAQTTTTIRNLFSASGDLSYDSASGQFSFDVESVYTKANFDSDLGDANTGQLPEGTNLYYTTARADSDAKASLFVVDAGGDGSLTYDSSSGVFTYTGPSASEVRAHLTANKGLSVTSGEFNIDSANVKQMLSATDAGGDGSFAYDNSTGVFTYTGPSATEVRAHLTANKGLSVTDGEFNIDSANVRGMISVTDAGGDGSLAYNSSNGTITYTGPSASEVRAHLTANKGLSVSNGEFNIDSANVKGMFSGGTGVTYSDGTISIGQAVATTDGVQFDSAQIRRISGSHLLFDSAFGDSATITNLATTQITGSQATLDSANITTLHVDGLAHLDSVKALQVDYDVLTADAPYQEGRLWYSSVNKTLNYYSDDQNVIHNLGIEEHQRVYNNTGSTITKGSPLYFSGNYSAGDIDVPTVGLADATDVNAYNAQGLAASDIANGSYGFCIIAGQLTGLNTSGLSSGTNFFVGLGPGLVQNASPTYPNYPMCLGWVVNTDSNNGVLLVNQQNHSVNSFRVRTSAHVGTDLQVDGNLSVLGTTTTVSTADVTAGSSFFRLNEGNAIGEAGTTFTGTGLDDAFYAGFFKGTTPQTYYVKIDGVGTGTGGVDTFAVALGADSAFASPILQNQDITGDAQLIHSTDNISIEFGATTGHTLNDVWKGTASPINVDTGFFTNRNTGSSGVGFTYMGLFYDVSDDRWKLVDEYDSNPGGTINVGDSSFSLGILKVDTLEGNVTGNVTGNLTGIANSAKLLDSAQNFNITGDVTAPNVSFNGNTGVTLNTTLANSGVTAGSYGSGSLVPVITVDAKGRITSASTTSVAGVSSTSFDSATNVFTINTADGSSFVTTVASRFSAIPDSDLTLSSNTIRANDLYVGDLHVDSADIIKISRDNISGDKGLVYASGTGVFDIDSANVKAMFTGNKGLAYSDGEFNIDSANVRAMFSAGGDLTYNSGTGEFSISRPEIDSAGVTTLARTAISVTDAGGDGSLGYDNSTGVLTYTGPSASEVRAHLTANKGLSVSSGEFNIDSANVRGMFSATGFGYNSGTGAFTVTGQNVMDLIKTVDSNGSGLNADTLDGQQGTYYRINVYNASGSLLN